MNWFHKKCWSLLLRRATRFTLYVYSGKMTYNGNVRRKFACNISHNSPASIFANPNPLPRNSLKLSYTMFVSEPPRPGNEKPLEINCSSDGSRKILCHSGSGANALFNIQIRFIFKSADSKGICIFKGVCRPTAGLSWPALINSRRYSAESRAACVTVAGKCT